MILAIVKGKTGGQLRHTSLVDPWNPNSVLSADYRRQHDQANPANPQSRWNPGNPLHP
jgi:hypothetical protein